MMREGHIFTTPSGAQVNVVVESPEWIPDGDAVCKKCRCRQAHTIDCPHRGEPWPKVRVGQQSVSVTVVYPDPPA